MATKTRTRPRRSIRGAKTSRPAKRRITPEDLLRFQLVGDPQISPDGQSIAFVKKHVNADKNEYVTNLWLVPTSGKGQPRQFTSGGKDSQLQWSRDGSRIAFVAAREKTKPQIFTIPAAGGEAVALTKFPEGSLGEIKWSPDGTLIAATFREQDPDWTESAKTKRKDKGLSDPPRVLDDWWYRLDGDGYFNAQRHHLYLIDARTGAHRSVYSKDTMGHFSFDFSPDSKRIVLASNRHPRAMIRPWKTELLILNIATGKVSAIPNLPAGPKDRVAWSPNGKRIAFAGREGEFDLYDTANLDLWICDPARGNARNLTGRQDYCLLAAAISDAAEVAFAANIRWAPDSKRIFMQIGRHGETHVASVPAGGGKIRFHTGGTRAYAMGNISADGTKMALTVADGLHLADVQVGRLSSAPMRTTPLSSFNAELLGNLKLAKPQAAWIRSADGTRVQVWCLKPIDSKPGKKYPAVQEIHGGPHAMYGVGFFNEFQLLAANGYAVFFSNPRGSKGYGRDFCSAIRGRWGEADWMDIQAVTGFMQRQSFVDPRRMGVMGGSYGGYMTNWVIGHTSDFKAAITDRCVSNLVSMFGTSDYTEEPDRYWPGNSWDKPEKRWAMSPLKYLGNCTTPTLIIHSEGDLRCNIEQAEQVFAVLKLRRIPTRFVRYPASTSHGMSRGGPPDMRMHRLRQILDWWKKYLK